MHNSFRVLFDKIASVYFIRKINLYFGIGSGQPGEPALCQLYRRTLVPCEMRPKSKRVLLTPHTCSCVTSFSGNDVRRDLAHCEIAVKTNYASATSNKRSSRVSIGHAIQNWWKLMPPRGVILRICQHAADISASQSYQIAVSLPPIICFFLQKYWIVLDG